MPGQPFDDQRLVIGQGQDADNRKLGDVLRRRRTDLKRRTEDVAEALGVTASYIRLIERGKRAPAPDKAEALLLELGLRPERTQKGDLRFRADEESWVLSFKHWATDPATGTGGFLWRAVDSLGPPIAVGAMMAPPPGAAIGGLVGWSQLRAFRERRSGVDESVSDEALMGAIIQRIARMPREELRDVAAAVEAIHAAHTAGAAASAEPEHSSVDWDDDAVVDAEVVEDDEVQDR